MKPLPLEFESGGFQYRQLRRVGDVVLLEQSQSHWRRPRYEVCIVRKRPDRKIAGKCIPARECLPSSEAWGTYGWTYQYLEKAEARFRQIVESRAQ